MASALSIATQGLLGGALSRVVQGFWDSAPPGTFKYFGFSIAQASLLSIALRRDRTLALDIASTEDLAVAFGRIKTLSLSSAETGEVTFGALQRARGLVTAIEEAVSLSASFTRVRNATFRLEASETVGASIGRSRTVEATVDGETLHTAALSRLRGIAAQVMEGLDYSFAITVYGPDATRTDYRITMTWDEWVLTGEQVARQPRSYTWTYDGAQLL